MTEPISDNRILSREEFCEVFEVTLGTEENLYQQYLVTIVGDSYPYYND